MLRRAAPVVARLIALAGLAVAVALAPARASACSCAMPTVRVTPGPGDGPAPLNTRIRLEFPLSGWLGDHNLRPEDVAITVRAGKAVVEVERKIVGDGEIRVVELTPKKRLLPQTHYQVSMTVAGAKESSLGEFVTGTAEDTVAPTWKGIGRAELVHKPAVCCDCSTGDPYVLVTVGEAGGEPAARALRWAVWLGDPAGKIDYGAPPAALVTSTSGYLWLGHASICSPANLALPRARSMRLGIKAVDLAGNQSDASEVIVKGEEPPKPAASPPATTPPKRH
jgi:hypothetical protein